MFLIYIAKKIRNQVLTTVILCTICTKSLNYQTLDSEPDAYCVVNYRPLPAIATANLT